MPGKWRNETAPYLAGIMDMCASRDVEEVTIVKAAQIGVSEAIRNVIGYYAHQEPDPVMLVMPDEQTGRRMISQRIIPLLRGTSCLRTLFTGVDRDVQLKQITLSNGFQLWLGWSGSPASLASNPCRVVINDEVDKFKIHGVREADPISLGYARTQTYEGRRKVVNISTPTTEDGIITQRFERSEAKASYRVPCPHCGTMQTIVFGQLKWRTTIATPTEQASEIMQTGDTWYECVSCRERIDEKQRAEMIRRGEWKIEGSGRRIGIHLWAGHCPWIPMRRIAAEFLRCKDDPVLMMGFANSWLGEPFRRQIESAKTIDVGSLVRAGNAPARVAPEWARIIIASADTQQDHFYFVVRAWGHGFRSQRIDHGIATSFDELRAKTLDARYPHQSGAMQTTILGIDSGGTGGRTHEVYRFCLSDPRIRAMKGASRPGDLPVRTTRVTYRPPRAGESPFDVFLTHVNTNHYKDRLVYTIQQSMSSEEPTWSLDDVADNDYARQMSSEHKIIVREGGRQREVWRTISSGAANHYWDCEVMQFALADMMRVDIIPPPQDRTADTASRPIERIARQAAERTRTFRRKY